MGLSKSKRSLILLKNYESFHLMKPFHKKEGKIKHKIKSHIFPVVIYGCERDYKESWVPKNWCFWMVVLEKTLESPLDCKEIKSVNPKGNQSWLLIGRTVTKAEAPIFRPPDVKSWFMRKNSDVGENWGQEEKGVIEGEMVGWHHWLNGYEFEQTLEDGEGQGRLVWGHKKLDTI